MGRANCAGAILFPNFRTIPKDFVLTRIAGVTQGLGPIFSKVVCIAGKITRELGKLFFPVFTRIPYFLVTQIVTPEVSLPKDPKNFRDSKT